MTKKKLSIAGIGELKKPERTEPVAGPSPAKRSQPDEPTKRGRGRPAERTAFVQFNSRISQDTARMIDEIAEREGCTLRAVIERAVEILYNK